MTNIKFLRDPRLVRVPVAVDLVVLTLQHGALCALAVERGIPPFVGKLALPGGFVRADESLEAAAARELLEETGIAAARVGHVEQLGTFGEVGRDPRERVIAVAYLALVPDLPVPQAGGDAAAAHVLPVDELLAQGLAFDHAAILRKGIERARAKLEYTPLAAAFCDELFTLNELRRVYETVWGTRLDPANFHRKATRTPGFVVPADETRQSEAGRPAQLYRRGAASVLVPPLLRTT